MTAAIGQTTALWQFLALLGVHWFADFVLQTRWQATNKSKRNDALAAHVAVYTTVLMIATPWIVTGELYLKWLLFAAVNGALHFATDYLTSRASSYFYAKQDFHKFFVVIGFDQLIHQATLAGTLALIFL